MPITKCALPNHALLADYRDRGAYTDCYVTEIGKSISHAELVAAFYTTWLFKLERWILAWAVAKPSTDEQARALAEGHLDSFAAWSVEGRRDNQLLLCDYQGRTRSWLMTEPLASEGRPGMRLYFGSAVVPVAGTATRKPKMGNAFNLLLGFHRLYSRALLGCARARCSR